MRTTIILDDHLGERLRQEARKRKLSFSAFVAEAGRQMLSQSGKAEAPEGFELITYGSGGVMEGVDLEKTGSLLASDDEEAYRT